MVRYSMNMAWRNLRRRMVFYSMHIGGLATGLAACLIISHHVQFHRSYDTYQPYSERTYRLNYARTTENGEYIRFASATPIIGSVLSERLPQIELLGMAYKADHIFLYNEHYSHDKGFYFGETALIDLLGLNIVQGSAFQALDAAGQMIISERMARNYFRDEDPLGQRLYADAETFFEVTAVFRDIPENSHFSAEAFISMELLKNGMPQVFQQGHFMSGFYNYLRLARGAEREEVNKLIAGVVNELYEPHMTQLGFQMDILLQPIEDIHLHSHFHHELSANGNHTAIRMLAIIAWFILIIAWANYINLSSIEMLRRSKETGIRKINGARSMHIRLLFVVESALANILAIALALMMAELLSPFVSRFTRVPSISPIWEHSWIYAMLAIAFIIGTLSVLLAAQSINRAQNLAQIIKAIPVGTKGKSLARKTMVSIQFILALGLILAGLTIFRQYHYIRAQDTGFTTDDILVMKIPLSNDSLSTHLFQSFRAELAGIPSVINSAYASVVPGFPVDHNFGGVRFEDHDNADTRNIRLLFAESDYFRLYEIPLLAGELFSGIYSVDSAKVILNESTVKSFGITTPEEAIGKRLFRGNQTFHIMGVVADIHQVSPGMMLEPLIYMPPSHYNGYVSVRIQPQTSQASLKQAEAVFHSFFPHMPFRAFWVDENYLSVIEQEKQFGIIFGMFSALAMFITLLGIMGVAAHTASQRQREIAIRKTLGASKRSIFMLLFKNYIGLILLAAVVAFPLSYYWLSRWLGQFAMQVTISPLSMMISLALVMLTSILTIFIQSQAVLRANPAEVLKD